jgi:hypothetical protein
MLCGTGCSHVQLSLLSNAFNPVQVLFFLRPDLSGAFGMFVECVCLAQQALIPAPLSTDEWDLADLLWVTNNATAWDDYYDTHHGDSENFLISKTDSDDDSDEGDSVDKYSEVFVTSGLRSQDHLDHVRLYSADELPSAVSVRGADVEAYRSCSDGTWSPDLVPHLVWQGSWTDLAYQASASAHATEKRYFAPAAALPECCEALSFALTEGFAVLGDNENDEQQCGSLREWLWTPLRDEDSHDAAAARSYLSDTNCIQKAFRGNTSMAELRDMPESWTFEQWHAFAGVRAFPVQQLRVLCVALKDQTLKLEDPEVRRSHRVRLCEPGAA